VVVSSQEWSIGFQELVQGGRKVLWINSRVLQPRLGFEMWASVHGESASSLFSALLRQFPISTRRAPGPRIFCSHGRHRFQHPSVRARPLFLACLVIIVSRYFFERGNLHRTTSINSDSDPSQSSFVHSLPYMSF